MITTKQLGNFIFSSRWMLYPVNLGLLAFMVVYVGAFLVNVVKFLAHPSSDLEVLMVLLLGFVDASMIANLIIMIVQGSHQIFIHKFELPNKDQCPQYLDHIDSGILKVKIALSIAGITLVQILKDFVNLEKIEWTIVLHRIYIHVIALLSALIMAFIWRVTHPSEQKNENHDKATTSAVHSS